MRHATLLGIFTLMLTLIPGLAFAENVIDDSKNPEYLFTLAATSGTFEGDTLTLKDVPLVVYFTDRPVRESGHFSLEKFIGMWDKGLDSFKDVPPTAELSVYGENGDKHDVFIISKPMIKGDTISFKIKELDEGDNIPKSFSHATLFIDNFRTVGGRIFK